ncbi:MAG: HprK-related kinase B [Proteobacteria bacterium]|nr:HprK-related kinase B [Pseudomonadota bacterium]MBU1593982.1 HprK-related kinase B [Pseudomonadota bacterium]
MSAPSLATLAQGLSARFPVRFGLRLRIEELTLRLRSNSAAVFEDLRGYFTGFVQAGDCGPADLEFLLLEAPQQEPPVDLAVKAHAPGKRADKERFADFPGANGEENGDGGGRVVRKQATGMLFLFGAGRNLAVGPCAANRNQLVNFICARYMERRLAAGWMLGHAAGVARPVSRGGRALALCGFAGLGKSTLALHLLTRGLDFLSNDRVLVEPAGPGRGPVLHGIPKHPRLNPGTALGNPALAPLLMGVLPEAARRAYAGLGPEALRAVEDKFDASIDACFGPGRFRLAAPLAGVVVLNWRQGGGAVLPRRVHLPQRPDLLEALRKPPGLFYLPQALAAGARLTPEQCLEALDGVPALELAGGVDFEAGAAACEAFLGA